MILGKNIESVYSNDRDILKVFSKGKLVWEKQNDDIDYTNIPFTVDAIADNVKVELTGNYKYSINGGLWTKGSGVINLQKCDRVRIKSTTVSKCKITGLSDVFGNIMSLARYEVPQDSYEIYLENERFANFFSNGDIRNACNLILPEILSEGCFYGMFAGCTSLITAPKLPVKKIKWGCYERMFAGCTSLTTAPELPATTLSYNSYRRMFYNCTSLTTAPKLPAKALAGGCYDEMFYKCTSLTTAPELPATTMRSENNLGYGCYHGMFNECVNLKVAPKLPATTLAKGCYERMFYNCTSLTIPPELPATTLAEDCYSYMFAGCTSLTTAPELPAPILADECYDGMFYYATNLICIKCLADASQPKHASMYVFDWTAGIKTRGKLICKFDDYDGKNGLENYIPSTWTVEYLT